MSAIRRILGHVAVEQAQRPRKCHRKPNDHRIQRGQQCLVIQEGASMGSKNYCSKCAKEILDKASNDLAEFIKNLITGTRYSDD
jgi:hypothetical protein